MHFYSGQWCTFTPALTAKLEKLKKLLEKGLITEEEAAAKRAKLLEDL